MNPLEVGLLVFVVVVIVLLILGLLFGKPADKTAAQVADTIEAFLEGTGDFRDWDDLITVAVKDDRLDEICRRISGLSREFPSPTGGEYCSEEGMEVLRRYLIELRSWESDPRHAERGRKTRGH